MEVPATNGASQGAAAGQSALTVPQLKQDFLKILVEQMRQQDPFAASENGGQFLSQMAEFSNLEQTQNLNSSVLALVTLMSQNAAVQDLSAGSALIGQLVKFTSSDGSEGLGIVNSVAIGSNGTFLNIDGENVPLLWIKEVLGIPEESQG